jgi:hypothetical protein
MYSVDTYALSPNITSPSARKSGRVVRFIYNSERKNETKSDADAG